MDTDTFTLNDLKTDDVSHLPIDDYGQDLSRAKGVISLAEMNCSWQKPKHTYYERIKMPSLQVIGRLMNVLTSATEPLKQQLRVMISDIPEALNPFDETFDVDSVAANMIFTLNRADPTPLLGVDLPPYDLYLDFRLPIPWKMTTCRYLLSSLT